jgi:hypothetical protein
VAPHYPMQLERPMRGHQGPYTMDPHPLPNRQARVHGCEGHAHRGQAHERCTKGHIGASWLTTKECGK